MAPDWIRISSIMENQTPNIYTLIIKDDRSALCKANKRKHFESLREAAPKVLELLEKGVAESRIAAETKTTVDFVRWVKWKHDSEKRANSFEVKLYELSRHRKYQKESTCKPIALSITALSRELCGGDELFIKITKATEKMGLEQIIEDQVRASLIGTVFSEEYYGVETREIDYGKLANSIDTWPCIAKRMVGELNIQKYLNFAFKNAPIYGLQPQQIGLLLLYSDEGKFKDKYNDYNYVGLAKKTGLPLDKVVEILKHK